MGKRKRRKQRRRKEQQQQQHSLLSPRERLLLDRFRYLRGAEWQIYYGYVNDNYYETVSYLAMEIENEHFQMREKENNQNGSENQREAN